MAQTRRSTARGLEQVPSRRLSAVPAEEAASEAARRGKRRGRIKYRIFTLGLGLDMTMLFLILVLLAVGLVMMFSASYAYAYYYYGNSYYFILRQGMFALVGVVLMLAISTFDYHQLHKLNLPVFAVSILLLLMVLVFKGTKLAPNKGGAVRWLNLGFVEFQPSEIAKLTVIICFSYWVARDPKSVRSVKTMVQPYGLLLAMYIGLLYLEPHTSAMVIICGIGVIILLAGGMRLWYFAPILGLGAGAVAAFYVAFPHVRTRFEVWLNPFSDMADKGLQGSMSQIAIGSGGLLGRGLGNGLQKQLYLPEPHNDFIFATWCEEMGLIGALLVILLFAYLIYRGFRVARYAPDKFGSLLATGITAKLAIQTLMNLFVVTGIMPVTGAALPFFSYGGTALLLQLGEMGILLNISRYMRIDGRNQD